MLRDLASLDRSLLIVSYDTRRKWGKYRRIDVWWGGLQHNGGLMLLCAYLITANHQWRMAEVTIRTVVEDEMHRVTAEERIRQVVASARVIATPVVLLRDGRAIADIMHEQSADADLVIVGLRLPELGDDFEVFFERMNRILDGLPTTVLVHSARSLEAEPVLFDEAAAPAPPTSQPGKPASPPAPAASRRGSEAAASSPASRPPPSHSEIPDPPPSLPIGGDDALGDED